MKKKHNKQAYNAILQMDRWFCDPRKDLQLGDPVEFTYKGDSIKTKTTGMRNRAGRPIRHGMVMGIIPSGANLLTYRRWIFGLPQGMKKSSDKARGRWYVIGIPGETTIFGPQKSFKHSPFIEIEMELDIHSTFLMKEFSDLASYYQIRDPDFDSHEYVQRAFGKWGV